MTGRRRFIGLILKGTSIVSIALTLLLFYSLTVEGNQQVEHRLYVSLLAPPYLLAAYMLYRHQKHHITGMMLLTLYLIIAAVTASAWSINTPFGILLFAFTILLSSVMFGPRYIIPTTAVVVLTIASVQALTSIGLLQPDTAPLSHSSVFGDVVAYSVIFSIFALLGWLSGTELQNLLDQSQRDQKLLKRQKDVIEKELQEEKTKLKEAYIQDLALSHEFIKIGQESVMVLHDIANQLSVLSLDLDEPKLRKKEITRAKQTVAYLDNLIVKTTTKINGSASKEFYISNVIESAIDELTENAKRRNVKIISRIDPSSYRLRISGDAEKLKQIFHILLSNAVQSYGSKKLVTSKVYCTLKSDRHYTYVKIKDYGIGISSERRKTLFTARSTSKSTGHGIGLYIARQIIEYHFDGALFLEPAEEYTEFTIKLPSAGKN